MRRRRVAVIATAVGRCQGGTHAQWRGVLDYRGASVIESPLVRPWPAPMAPTCLLAPPSTSRLPSIETPVDAAARETACWSTGPCRARRVGKT
jgi:hypothetical protein